jgi:hypothetical protein
MIFSYTNIGVVHLKQFVDHGGKCCGGRGKWCGGGGKFCGGTGGVRGVSCRLQSCPPPPPRPARPNTLLLLFKFGSFFGSGLLTAMQLDGM